MMEVRKIIKMIGHSGTRQLESFDSTQAETEKDQ